MVRRDFRREEVMLVHIQQPWRLDPATATCSGWENNIKQPPAVWKAWEDAGGQGRGAPAAPSQSCGISEKKPNNSQPQVWALVSTLLTPAAGLSQDLTPF